MIMCLMLSLSHPSFPCSPTTILPAKTKQNKKPLSSSFQVAHESAGGQSHDAQQLQTLTNSRTRQLPRSTSLASVFMLHYDFTLLPLPALTCLSCDPTQAFFRDGCCSDGLGRLDHLIWPISSCIHVSSSSSLFAFVPPDYVIIWPVEQISSSSDVFKGLSCQRTLVWLGTLHHFTCVTGGVLLCKGIISL